MSVHIEASSGQIAENILLPGDPLRAELIANEFLEDAECYNKIRGMLGFTGTYKGKRVSVQGTGMGMPSMSIYAKELLDDYKVKKLVRVGTAGAMQADIKIGELILAQGACTDSNINRLTFSSIDYAPIASFDLLSRAHQAAQANQKQSHIGNILTSDRFYVEDQKLYDTLKDHGILAVDMETAALYTLAARYQAQALAIMTISDQLITGERASAQERQHQFLDMVETALNCLG
ncbi:purine-nucleoside phosphorylase [Piscirickettsia litoralis]|uniref:Purine nucleoside phosphorylase DeoD-type n=1 Tax=Piscirickettsia litoralis TaxID=1891921 RepID=A0ABX3A3Q3_9GAMM|nr:purine-nucleoside phosphorylase [Piscirickettsia litoralis]ODN43489.1 purine-nucleoside phosphorylase [Piscirickettsia litoralis]